MPMHGEISFAPFFHIWAREDIGRITITLFEETLRIWCGEPLREQRQLAANSACFCLCVAAIMRRRRRSAL